MFPLIAYGFIWANHPKFILKIIKNINFHYLIFQW